MKSRSLLPLVFTILGASAAPESPVANDAAERKAKAAEKAERARSETELVKRQCRSVHLGFQTPKLRAAYLEIIPEKTTAGTYFCALGFDLGYAGLQDLGDGRRLAIFSVWEQGAADESKTHDAKAPDGTGVTLIEMGEDVSDGRFGKNGVARVARYQVDWETGKPVRFFIEGKPSVESTDFSAHIFDPGTARWKLMAVFRTRSGGAPLQNLYSFIEDFRRNYESTKVARRCVFSNGWALDLEGKWLPMLEARFTGDATPSPHIDAGFVTGGFFLQTGGDTENRTTRIWQKIKREAEGSGSRPEELDKLLRP